MALHHPRHGSHRTGHRRRAGRRLRAGGRGPTGGARAGVRRPRSALRPAPRAREQRGNQPDRTVGRARRGRLAARHRHRPERDVLRLPGGLPAPGAGIGDRQPGVGPCRARTSGPGRLHCGEVRRGGDHSRPGRGMGAPADQGERRGPVLDGHAAHPRSARSRHPRPRSAGPGPDAAPRPGRGRRGRDCLPARRQGVVHHRPDAVRGRRLHLGRVGVGIAGARPRDAIILLRPAPARR